MKQACRLDQSKKRNSAWSFDVNQVSCLLTCSLVKNITLLVNSCCCFIHLICRSNKIIRCAVRPIFLVIALLLGKIPPPFFEHLYSQTLRIIWCFSDRASWIDCILNTNLMHLLLFIHKILFSSTCFEPQVLIFRRIQLYTCSIWYCHSLWEFLVACRYTAWVRTDWRKKVVGECLKTPTNNLPPPVSSHSSCVPTCHQELSQRVTVPYAACIQLYPPEVEHLRLKTCRGE